MQHQKYVKPRKNEMMDMTSNSSEASQGGNDVNLEWQIFIVINAHKKHHYVFFFIHDSMSITIKPININYKSNIKKEN
jgi:hypothetical protein